MKFRKHLFISYAHLDNQPVAENDVGWVSRFHKSLDAILSMRLGCKAEIWRDERQLQGNDAFAQAILSQFPDTAALVAVVSPRYVQSEWCLREARSFCESASTSGGLMVDNKSRIFKVITLPVDSQDPLPAPMRETLGFDFFVRDANGVEKELNPAYDPSLGPKLTNECVRLAHDIASLVKMLEAQPQAGTAAAPAAVATSIKPGIYLAECSKDRRDDRTALRTELQMRGYRVLPEGQLPDDEDQYRAEVLCLLGECALSIHLVGSLYGGVCDGESQKSVVELQNLLAVQQARTSPLRRIISLPDSVHTTDPRQQAFIDQLHRDADAQFAADVITADLEGVKGAVQATLTRIENPQAAPEAPAATDNRMIYLVCDERDRKATVPLRLYLKAQGLEVQTPVFEGDAASVRNANQDRMARCDAVLVFHGVGTEAWKDSVEGDLRKAVALRAGRPAPLFYTWLAEPPTSAKLDCIDMGEANAINALQGFSEGAAAPFLAALTGLKHG
jgi:TIR domain